jgi:hypothetical protein
MTITETAQQSRRNPSRARRTAPLRPLAWLRDYPGAETLPSQQAVDTISNTADFPRH